MAAPRSLSLSPDQPFAYMRVLMRQGVTKVPPSASSPSPCSEGLVHLQQCHLLSHKQAVNASGTAGDRWRSATLSLDGVLDYDESDKDEVTFELSLFAESFQDMLMRDYGETVYEAMQSFR